MYNFNQFLMLNLFPYAMKKIVLLVLVSSLFLACSKKESKVEDVEKAFYYWKSNDYSNSLSAKISKANVPKIGV